MALLQMQCPNCCGAMVVDNNQIKCQYCGTMILNIVDAKIDADVSIISPVEFAKKIEESKNQFVIHIKEKQYEVFDVKTKVINKRIADACALLEAGNFNEVYTALNGVPNDILSAERLRYLAAYHAKNEAELLEYNGYVENEHYQKILQLAEPQTRTTYEKIAAFCREKYDAREEATAKVREGEELVNVGLHKDALIYAQKMCQDYPMYAITWLFLAHVKRAIDPRYDCAREWGMINHCFDYKYYDGNFPYGLNELFAKKYGHNVEVSGIMKRVYGKWGNFVLASFAAFGSANIIGICLLFMWIPLVAAISILIAPFVFLFNLPRLMRGKRVVEEMQGASLKGENVDKFLQRKARRKKRIAIFLMSLPFLIAISIIIPITCNFEWHEGMRYRQRDGQLYLVDANPDDRTSGEVVIPESIDGMPVVAIEEWAFKESYDLEGAPLTHIVIPASVKSVETKAFYGCGSLVSVTFAENSQLTSVGREAFAYCENLVSIAIPNSVTKIGNQVFYGCKSLERLTVPFIGERLNGSENTYLGYFFAYGDSYYETAKRIPATLKKVTVTNGTKIGDNAFADCTSLTSITLPNSITSIGVSAFSNCSSLTSIKIPNSVTSIENSAFWGCSSLTSITLSNSVTSIERSVFSGCSSLTSITLSNSVTSIENSAFLGCSSLTSIKLPDSVISVGESAFYDCKSLASIVVSSSLKSVGKDAFKNCTALKKVYIVDLSAWCGIDFENTLSNPLNNGADFYVNNKLVAELNFSNNVKEVKKYAFYGCTSVTSVTIPQNLTTIGAYAFSQCTSLTSATFEISSGWKRVSGSSSWGVADGLFANSETTARELKTSSYMWKRS